MPFDLTETQRLSLSQLLANVYEDVLHPDQFAGTLTLRHMVGDWDIYGYDRGKNASFYYALNEDKWYLLPWDIDLKVPYTMC